VNISTGGGQNMTVDERIAAARRAEPEMCSLNMGTMNFGLYPALSRYDDWKYDWEPDFLEASRDFVFRNTFKDIEKILAEIGEGCGSRFEFECYDVGHVYTLAHFLERGLVKPPLFVQFVLGVLGGIGASAGNLVFMKHTADQLLGPENFRFSVLGAGRHQMAMCTAALTLGGNVRVGLEDNLYIAKGRLAASNAEQVRKIRTIAENLSLEIATPQDTRIALALKGGDRVAF
jgi:uncharacterized protein (DUF849 family)